MASPKTNDWYCDMYHTTEWFAFYIFIYDLSQTLLFNVFICFVLSLHMQKKNNHTKKRSGSFETKRLLLSTFKEENNQVLFFYIMFILYLFFKMSTQSYLVWLQTGAVIYRLASSH